jgi:hypothetical protein
LIAENASARLKDMSDAMMQFQTEVITDIGHWMWHDPISVWHNQKPIGAGLTLDTAFTPEMRTGDFYSFNIKINPYRKHSRAPSQQGEYLIQMLERLLMPAQPLMAQAGMGLDWEDIFKTVSRLTDTPEMARWIQYMQGEQMPQPEPKGGMPNNTTRTYKRVNASEKTDHGMREALIRTLAGKQDGGGGPVVGAA